MLRLCLVSMLFFQCLTASAYTIYVTVTDTYTNQPLENARVEIHNHRKQLRSVKTDSNGIARIERVHRPMIHVHVIDDSGRFEPFQHYHSHFGAKFFRLKAELVPNALYEAKIEKMEDSLYGTWTQACRLQYMEPEDRYYSRNRLEDAHFPGGDRELANFLDRKSRLPAASWENRKDNGRVNFVVEEDGSISHVHVVDTDSPEIQRELKRLFWAMPLWVPKTTNGEPVRSVRSVRVIFEMVGP